MSDEIRNVKDAMFKYWANHPCGIGIAEANAEWHIKQTAALREQIEKLTEENDNRKGRICRMEREIADLLEAEEDRETTAIKLIRIDRDALRTQLAEAQARIEVKDAAISRVLKYLRSPEDEAAEFVERVLDSALSPTAGQSLLEEVKGLRGALESIRDATNPDDEKSYRCDDREGCLDWVNGHAQEALKKGGK